MGQGKQANTTVIWAASATGQIIPSYIIFKGKLDFHKNSKCPYTIAPSSVYIFWEIC